MSKTANDATATIFVQSGGQVLAEYAAGTEETLFYHRNRQYTVIGLTDDTGAVVERYAYNAYGNPTALAPDGTTVRTTSSYGNTYLHTGRRYDPAELPRGRDQ
ncbi:MAG: hypothetical protein AAGC72_09035 [Planctomycetota bacterium]